MRVRERENESEDEPPPPPAHPPPCAPCLGPFSPSPLSHELPFPSSLSAHAYTPRTYRSITQRTQLPPLHKHTARAHTRAHHTREIAVVLPTLALSLSVSLSPAQLGVIETAHQLGAGDPSLQLGDGEREREIYRKREGGRGERERRRERETERERETIMWVEEIPAYSCV